MWVIGYTLQVLCMILAMSQDFVFSVIPFIYKSLFIHKVDKNVHTRINFECFNHKVYKNVHTRIHFKCFDHKVDKNAHTRIHFECFDHKVD